VGRRASSIDPDSRRKIDAVFFSTGTRAKHPEAAERQGLDRIYRFHVPPGTDTEALAATLSTLPGVEYAEPDAIVHAQGFAPNDPLYPQQWGLSMMAAEDAWAVAVGEDVVIAVLDSGIDSDHPDMTGKWDPGYDFVNDDADPEDDSAISHGTQVASVISASTNNTEGIAGVCWDCRRARRGSRGEGRRRPSSGLRWRARETSTATASRMPW
jgi:hypothetical protein